MAKQIKAAIMLQFIVYWWCCAVYFGQEYGRLAGFFTAAETMAAFTFATTLTASVIGKMTSKGINASAGNFGSKFATRAPLAPRQIVYGKCRIGGTWFT
jgi:hypothetical protein